jgi:hypothetical protein
MLDVRPDRRGGYLRKLHGAEVRDEMLDPSKRIGQRLSLVDLIVRFDKLRSIGNAQILDDDPFTPSDGAFSKTKGVLLSSKTQSGSDRLHPDTEPSRSFRGPL